VGGEDTHHKLATFSVTRDPELRRDLVEAHLSLARRLVCRFTHRRYPPEDLVQVASLALIKAVDRFDPERGVEFSTYATVLIVGELKRHLRDKGWAVRPPRRLQEMSIDVEAVISTFTGAHGRAPTSSELAREAGLTTTEVSAALQASRARYIASLDNADTDCTEGVDPLEQLCQEDSQSSEIEERAALGSAIAKLSDRQRMVLYLRFFEERTQADIADLIGTSQIQVSRILRRSLSHLRAYADADRHTPLPQPCRGEHGTVTITGPHGRHEDIATCDRQGDDLMDVRPVHLRREERAPIART
jgi:RNA polymerase sigma-B factor